VRIRESHALLGEPIEMRRLNLGLRIVAGHIAIAEVVREDDDEVGLLSGEDSRLETAGKKEGQEKKAHVDFGNAESA
jgi:hypothetical protein